MRAALAAVLLLLGGCASAPPPPPRSLGPVERGVLMPSGKELLVRVADQGGGPVARDRVAAVAGAALPELERVAGFAYPRPFEVEVRVHAARRECGGELGVYDARERCIRVIGAIPSWLLVHELAHAWFGERFSSARWVVEGLAHHAALSVLRARPELGDEAWVRASLLAAARAEDVPLGSWSPPHPLPPGWTDADERRKNAFYGKAGLFFDLIAARLSEEALVKAARSVVELGEPRDGMGYLNALARADERVEGLVPGWIRAGTYAVGLDALDDPDRDGLATAEEEALGLDPARFDSNGDGKGDGDAVRFYRSPAGSAGHVARATDPAGDALDAVAEADLVRVEASCDGTILVIALETAGGFAREDVFWNVTLETDEDELLAGFGWKHDPWLGRTKGVADHRLVEWRPLARERAAFDGKRATLSLPVAMLGRPRRVRLIAYSAVRGGAMRGDEVEPFGLEVAR